MFLFFCFCSYSSAILSINKQLFTGSCQWLFGANHNCASDVSSPFIQTIKASAPCTPVGSNVPDVWSVLKLLANLTEKKTQSNHFPSVYCIKWLQDQSFCNRPASAFVDHCSIPYKFWAGKKGIAKIKKRPRRSISSSAVSSKEAQCHTCCASERSLNLKWVCS